MTNKEQNALDSVTKKLNECRTIIDNMRFSLNSELTNVEFDKFSKTYDYICKALDQIL